MSQKKAPPKTPTANRALRMSTAGASQRTEDAASSTDACYYTDSQIKTHKGRGCLTTRVSGHTPPPATQDAQAVAAVPWGSLFPNYYKSCTLWIQLIGSLTTSGF